jgi:hypothetical protein
MQWLSRSPKCPVLAAVSYSLGFTIMGVIFRSLPGAHGGPLSAHPVQMLFALFTVFAMLTFGASWFYGLGFSVTSLRLRSWSGRYVDVPWHSMQRAEPSSLLGLPLLRVYYADSARPACIPLWTSDLAGFRSAANAAAGQGNPVVRWIADHPDAGRFRWT